MVSCGALILRYPEGLPDFMWLFFMAALLRE
jgi:hypothetical protein